MNWGIWKGRLFHHSPPSLDALFYFVDTWKNMSHTIKKPERSIYAGIIDQGIKNKNAYFLKISRWVDAVFIILSGVTLWHIMWLFRHSPTQSCFLSCFTEWNGWAVEAPWPPSTAWRYPCLEHTDVKRLASRKMSSHHPVHLPYNVESAQCDSLIHHWADSRWLDGLSDRQDFGRQVLVTETMSLVMDSHEAVFILSHLWLLFPMESEWGRFKSCAWRRINHAGFDWFTSVSQTEDRNSTVFQILKFPGFFL